MNYRSQRAFLFLTTSLVAVLIAACDGGGDSSTGLSGTIEIDGSSTVFPVSAAVAEEFLRTEPDVRVNIGVSGTGGGFKRFVTGETDISGASRPMKQSEVDAAAANGIEYVQMVVAIDGLTVVVHPDNQFADCLTIEELRRIWEPFANEATQVRNELGNWSQVRPGFPDQQLRLYGADTDSGTFDYFTEVVVGEAQSSRSDYTASADDNVLVLGIAGDKNSLGYFGYAYYAENSNQLKAVAVDAGEGCVEPNPKNIESGAYSPLSRPLFIYLNLASADRPEVREFLKFYMAEAGRLSTEVGYVPVATAAYAENLALVGIE